MNVVNVARIRDRERGFVRYMPSPFYPSSVVLQNINEHFMEYNYD